MIWYWDTSVFTQQQAELYITAQARILTDHRTCLAHQGLTSDWTFKEIDVCKKLLKTAQRYGQGSSSA